MKKRKCNNPDCPQEFYYPTRSDQKYCCTKCRNRVNNQTYKFKMAPYKKISDNLRQQDEDLTNLLKENKAALINFEKFAKYSIDIRRALTLTYYEDGRLKKAVFNNFVLTHFKDQQYKIERK